MTFTACDCQYHLSGVVLDKNTLKPIKDVKISNPHSSSSKTLTKENGDYEIYGLSGRCDEITLLFMIDGYETQKITFSNNSTDTVLLGSTTAFK